MNARIFIQRVLIFSIPHSLFWLLIYQFKLNRASAVQKANCQTHEPLVVKRNVFGCVIKHHVLTGSQQNQNMTVTCANDAANFGSVHWSGAEEGGGAASYLFLSVFRVSDFRIVSYTVFTILRNYFKYEKKNNYFYQNFIIIFEAVDPTL